MRCQTTTMFTTDPEIEAARDDNRAFCDRLATMGPLLPPFDTLEKVAAARQGGVPQAILSQPTVRPVEERTVPGRDGPIPVRIVRPEGTPKGVYVDIHGGGFCIGWAAQHDVANAKLAQDAGVAVVSVDYRLAPEHPFPAPAQDAEDALRWATGPGAALLGHDPALVSVGGDSAGGQLAALAALRAPGLAHRQLLVYPALDPEMASAAYTEFADGPMLTAAEMALCWGAYLPDGTPTGAAVPGTHDLADAPPAWIAVAAIDPLRDDGPAYAEALRAAGVAVTVERYDDMTHGFLRWGGAVDRAHELIASLAAAAK